MVGRNLGLLMLVMGLVACGGESKSTTEPLTREQANVMADLVYRNYESGGADFALSATAGSSGGTITLTGEVDWVNKRGHAMVMSSALAPAPVTEVWWNEVKVFERRPALDEMIRSVGLVVSSAVIGRPVDTEHRRIDQLIAIIMGLSATQRDNAELIVQADGSAFVRTDRLREIDVEVLRYGQYTLYWVDMSTGEMVRVEGSDETGQFGVVIDILSRGPREIVSDPSLSMIDVFDLPPNITDLMSTSP